MNSRTVCEESPPDFSTPDLSATSVRLQWGPPAASEYRFGAPDVYEVVYRERRDGGGRRATNTTETTLVVDGLRPETEYIFQIRAHVGQPVCAGPWSYQLFVWTSAASRRMLHPPTL